MTWESEKARGIDYEDIIRLTRSARVEKMFLKDAVAREMYGQAFRRLLEHARCKEYGPYTQFNIYITTVDVGQRAGLTKEVKEAAQEGIAMFETAYPEEWKASLDNRANAESLRLTVFQLTQQGGSV